MKQAVMFVLNDVRTDSRVLREASTLASAGYAVTVMGRTTDPYAPDGQREDREGFRIVRVPVAGGTLRWLHLARQRLRPSRHAAEPGADAWRRPGSRRWDRLDWESRWRFAVLPWARAAAAAAPRADVLHAHDMRSLPAAIMARRTGNAPIVYDSHEIYVESGPIAARAPMTKEAITRQERSLARQASVLITVNDALAAILGPSLGIDRVVTLYNCPPRWQPPTEPEERIRRATGIPANAPIVLFHGGLSPERGIEQAIAALRAPGVERAHLVFMGYGPGAFLVDRNAADPSFGGRIHRLPPVAPPDVPAWVAGADVDLAPAQPTTLNHRLATPNKVFEALAAGVPLVASDFPPLREILRDGPFGPLGELCDPREPASIAAALRSVLDLGETARRELRDRCLRAAHERWNWETESAKLVALYEDLAPGGDPRADR